MKGQQPVDLSSLSSCDYPISSDTHIRHTRCPFLEFLKRQTFIKLPNGQMA